MAAYDPVKTIGPRGHSATAANAGSACDVGSVKSEVNLEVGSKVRAERHWH
jgi:hypothetical protein